MQIDEGTIEFVLYFGDVAQTLLWIPFEAPLEHPPHGRGRGLGHRGPVRFAAENRCDRIGNGFSAKRRLARQHFVQHASKRPDVGPLVDRFATSLIRAHVCGGSKNDAGASGSDRHSGRARQVGRAATVIGVDFREAEIEHLDDAARRGLDVGGFEIAVNDALPMRSVQCVGDLSRDAQRLGE